MRTSNIWAAFLAGCLLILAACTAERGAPATTAPTRSAPTAAPTAVPATEMPATPAPRATDATAPTEPARDELAAFVETLETAVLNQEYDRLQSLMGDPIAVGAWGSEWQILTPAEAVAQFRAGAIPPPYGVRFTRMSDEALAALLGQPTATFFGPGIDVAAALHSVGWGQSSSDDAVLFVVEKDGRFTWDAFLYTHGRFADVGLAVVAAPTGLIYSVFEQGIYQIQADGFHRQLLDAEAAMIPNIKLSPDGRYAAYLTLEGNELWLLDTLTNERRRLAADHTLSAFLAWGASDTLLVGVWLSPDEAGGPNNGHAAVVDVTSGAVRILDENRLMANRPALSPAGPSVAFDVYTASEADTLTGRIYHPETGLRVFDPAAFTPIGEVIDRPRFNVAWSLDGQRMAWLASTGDQIGVQVFDLAAMTVRQLHDWDPARFGALIPSPVWSPDGQWLALEIWANGFEGSGIWLLATDGGRHILVDGQGREPHWTHDGQLLFGVNGSPRLYDIKKGEAFRLELPEGSWALGVTALDDLQALSDTFAVVESEVGFIMAAQDVMMYSGPDESFREIGFIAEGMTARVTGRSERNDWWRVICPDDTVGDCWVSPDPAFTHPANAAGQ